MNVLCRAVVAACCVFAAISSTHALPPPEPILANVIVPTGTIHARSGIDWTFPLMLGVPLVTTQVTVQFPVELANSEVSVQTLDGADLSYNGSAVAADGTVQFNVVMPSQPGLYRVQLIIGDSTTAVLQFWVLSTSGDNPPLLIPEVGTGTPGGTP